MEESYYDILNVKKTSTMDEIKKSYRKLSLQHHPDKNPGNPESIKMFQKITEAYERIGNEDERKKYDFELNNPFFRTRSMNPADQMGFPFPFPFPFSFHEENTGNPMEDMFSNIFGNMEGPNVHIFHGGMPLHLNQAPIVKTIEVTLDKVYTGDKVPVEIQRKIQENGRKSMEKETIYVTIPKGVDDNEIIVIKDKGNIYNNLKSEVKIYIKVEKHKTFSRSGLDLIYEKKITLKESLCGFSFDLKHINNKVYTINNNKGNIIPNGFRKIIPNMGLEREEYKGNLIIVFEVEYPTSIELEKIEQLEKIL